jgi:hypoxanthine phosphoribosyltransferase
MDFLLILPLNYTFMLVEKNKIIIKGKVFTKLFEESQILTEIKTLSLLLEEYYRDKNPLVLVVLKGAYVFAGEFLKFWTFPMELDFIRYQSYIGAQSQGKIQNPIPIPLIEKNRHILILEDIVDSGLTLKEIRKDLEKFFPAGVRVASLLYKPDTLKYGSAPEHYCIEVQNQFLIGFGLDYDEKGRNLRELYALNI